MRRGWRALSWQVWLAIVVAVVAVVPAVTIEGFTHPLTVFVFLKAFALLGMLAVGQSLVMAAGGIDLSLGSTFGFSAMILAMLRHLGYSFEVTILAGLGVGIAFGLINGLLVTKLRFKPFIATFAMLAIIRAGAYLLHYVALEERMLSVRGTVWTYLATGHSPLWVPPSFLILIGVAVGAWWLLNRTRFGLWAYAIGGNLNAARTAAIPVDRVRILTYVMAGALAAMAGMLNAGALEGVRPYFGAGMELMSLAAVIIGGASLAGGSASIVGTLLAVLLITLADRGLAIMGLAPHSQEIAMGLIVLSALIVARLVPKGAIGEKKALKR
jgi:ribose/xylose/arabinose/galactoside ABC-type transport system permease subunit